MGPTTSTEGCDFVMLDPIPVELKSETGKIGSTDKAVLIGGRIGCQTEIVLRYRHQMLIVITVANRVRNMQNGRV